MHRTQLIYILDPMCSWCWGFSPVVRQILQRAQIAKLPVTLRVGGLRSGEQAILDDNKRAAILGHWQRVAETTDQPFNFTDALPSGFLYDTEPACRALVVARQLDASLLFSFLERMQRAFYQNSQDITQANTLCELAAQAGYCPETFSTAWHATATQQATQHEFAWVRSVSVAGFPTLLAVHEQNYTVITNGYQPYASLEPLLNRWISVYAGN